MINKLKILKKLELAHKNYTNSIADIEKEIIDKIKFRFSIFWQAGDGFIISDEEMGNAPIDSCLEIINKKGILSHEDYRNICI
jgi:hypothetical protein